MAITGRAAFAAKCIMVLWCVPTATSETAEDGRALSECTDTDSGLTD